MQTGTPRKRWLWYHGVLMFVGIQVVTLALSKLVEVLGKRGGASANLLDATVGNEDNDAFYNDQKLPVFAPPDWSFAPVWTLNNALVIWGLLRTLNKPANTPGRTRYLALQGLSLLMYCAFNGAYFGLKSPINGAALTDANLLVILEALRTAREDMQDNRVALSLVTLVPWLLLAAPVSTSVALWNKDAFWKAGPFMQPPAALVKPPKAE